MMQKSASILALAAGATALGSCPSNSSLSCHNTTAVQDTCCFITAGQLLQTQFWDTDPPTGPSDSWTIHGLWPDNCNGSYPAQCDTNRAYTDIAQILTDNNATDTLAYMQQYWKDYQGDDETFWEHEWGKHGTCISTLEPSCYGAAYQTGEEAAAFFTRTVALFQTRPTYQWLADAGIAPSSGQTYSASQIQSALADKHGAPVTLGCQGGALNQVWYHFNVKGSLQDGQFVPAQPDGVKSKQCRGNVKYLPKSGGSDDPSSDSDNLFDTW